VIAALFVQRNGCYWNLDGVDPWDEERDARLYDGPWPVVAHPPCARWCLLAGLVEHRYGIRKGDDGGCFASALESVRRWGGVLEHPAYSAAFAAHGLPAPNARGGWQRTLCGGAVCHVEQSRYGHRARKATWLYAVADDLPAMRWGVGEGRHALVSYCYNSIPREAGRPRLSSKEASATPPEFREVLLAIARSCSPR
jgi:hypothetical protein